MNEYLGVLRVTTAICLVIAFGILFQWMAEESLIRRLLRRTVDTMDASARQRERENRRLLSLQENRSGMVYRIEQKLIYSGLAGKWLWLTPERWILCNLVLCAGVYGAILLITGKWLTALAGGIGTYVAVCLAIRALINRNYNAVNRNLLKFLDFLGNYSITAGEVTGIFYQISKYLEEPLGSVLEACYYEAQTSGDVGLALLTMAEKIEHPRFKELVRNMEISIRYSADFTTLVLGSRRTIREDLRTSQERKALANEALINMVILMAMSVVILMVVEQMIHMNIRQIMIGTLPGRLCILVVFVIVVLFYCKMHRLDR